MDVAGPHRGLARRLGGLGEPGGNKHFLRPVCAALGSCKGGLGVLPRWMAYFLSNRTMWCVMPVATSTAFSLLQNGYATVASAGCLTVMIDAGWTGG